MRVRGVIFRAISLMSGWNLFFFFQPKWDCYRTKAASERRINWEARIGVEHFIARFDQRHHRQGKRHLAAGCDQNLLGGNVEPARAFQVFRNRCAQLRHAACGTMRSLPAATAARTASTTGAAA